MRTEWPVPRFTRGGPEGRPIPRFGGAQHVSRPGSPFLLPDGTLNAPIGQTRDRGWMLRTETTTFMTGHDAVPFDFRLTTARAYACLFPATMQLR